MSSKTFGHLEIVVMYGSLLCRVCNRRSIICLRTRNIDSDWMSFVCVSCLIHLSRFMESSKGELGYDEENDATTGGQQETEGQ